MSSLSTRSIVTSATAAATATSDPVLGKLNLAVAAAMRVGDTITLDDFSGRITDLLMSHEVARTGPPIAGLTTNGLTGRLHRQGRQLEHAWLLDAAGHTTHDPAVLFTDPPGTILPTGGLDAGHKGYGLALLVELLCNHDETAVIGVHFYLAERSGQLAAGGLANSHGADFQRLQGRLGAGRGLLREGRPRSR